MAQRADWPRPRNTTTIAIQGKGSRVPRSYAGVVAQSWGELQTLPLRGFFGREGLGRWQVVKSKAFTSLLSRLRELRKTNGLTQEGFAEMAGISYKYYQAVEGGRKAELRFSTLEKLAAAYGIELWELLAPTMPTVRLTAAPKRKRAPKAQSPKTRERG